MPNSMDVDPGLLVSSAAAAAAHSQTVFAAHSTAANSVDAALPGWVGSSRAALTATARRWIELSAELNLRLYQHSEALRISGLAFAEMDGDNASRLSCIKPGAPE